MENQVTQLLKAMVKPDYTACSYAFYAGWKNCLCRCDWCHRQNQQSIHHDGLYI